MPISLFSVQITYKQIMVIGFMDQTPCTARCVCLAYVEPVRIKVAIFSPQLVYNSF